MLLIPLIALIIFLIIYFAFKIYGDRINKFLILRRLSSRFKAWENYLENDFEYFHLIPLEKKKKFLEKIALFIGEKSWKIEEEKSKVVIAARACLPTLYRSSKLYPQVVENFENHSLEDWLQFHEQQFLNEVGPEWYDRELRDNFITYSKSILLNSVEEVPLKYREILKQYYLQE